MNSLRELAPKYDGKTTINGVIRSCLYALAPVEIWQYFSSQGRSKATKYSLLTNLPNIYQVLLMTCAHASRLPQNDILHSISTVMKSCKSRSVSIKYRRNNPQYGLVDNSVDEIRPLDDKRPLALGHENFRDNNEFCDK